MEKLFFNSSMPRSGSELLNVILHQNPLVYGSTTSPLLEYQYGARSNYELPEVKSQNPKLMQKAFISMCGSMAQGYYESITDRPYVIDKNRGWSFYYEWVEQWNPNPKMICMVRDLRSIIASMEKIYRKNRHRPTGPDNPAEMQNLTAEQRVGCWLNTQPVGLALQRTADLFQRKLDKHILFVRYEDLCNDPVATLKTVYDYLELEPFEHDFNCIEKQVQEDDSHFGVYGQHNIQRQLRPSEPDSRQAQVSEFSSDQIKQTFQWYFDNFYSDTV